MLSPSIIASPILETTACALRPVEAMQDSKSFDAEAIRSLFPVFQKHANLLFFDNAATTQKPETVTAVIEHFYEEKCSNAGRGSYSWSTQLARKVEEARKTMASLLSASTDDLAFTSGATDSLNTVAMSWGLSNLKDGDEVLLCLDDHQSAILPWFNVQALLRSFGIEIKIIPFAMHYSGTYDRKSICERLSAKTRLIALTHIHHLYGMEMDLPELRELLPEHVVISLDASQSIGHVAVDVQTLYADFISFSAHKMFAANGVGVLWADAKRRAEMKPMRLGGKSSVRLHESGFELDVANLANIVESGTLNWPGILSLTPAANFIQVVGIDNIEAHVSMLTQYLHGQLEALPGIEFAPGFGRCGCSKGYGIIGFRLTDVGSSDLSAFLDSNGIFVRTGNHCLASAKLGDDYLRVSLHAYNTVKEIDRLIDTLGEAIQ
jgi:cysteine desulfurase / selenocysteine lyase